MFPLQSPESDLPLERCQEDVARVLLDSEGSPQQFDSALYADRMQAPGIASARGTDARKVWVRSRILTMSISGLCAGTSPGKMIGKDFLLRSFH